MKTLSFLTREHRTLEQHAAPPGGGTGRAATSSAAQSGATERLEGPVPSALRGRACRSATSTIRKKLSCALLALLAVGTLASSAQTYSIPWPKIAGGCGLNSTGGVYAVSGTIGQPDASGALTGGFWPGVTLVQTPEAPLLASELLPGGSVRIFWPLPGTGFVLDQTTALASPPAAISWSQVAFPYQTNATHISITVPSGVGSKFYRLRHP